MDDFDWTAARAQMVRTQIEARGLTSTRVLAAMREVPREHFVPATLRGRAYEDHALSIGHQQTIFQPYIVALMTEALGLQRGERILEVGTSSGYQTAVLSHLAASVWSMERLPEQAPFDAIVVTAGAPSTPPSLLRQLSDHSGVLVAPVGDTKLQQLVKVRRLGTNYTTTRLIGCRFVPLVGREGWRE